VGLPLHQTHCEHRDSAALLNRENLLGPLKLSLLGGPSNALCVSTSDRGHYLHGAFFVSRLTVLLKKTWVSLQQPLNLTLIHQLEKGLPQLPALSGRMPILLMEFLVLPRIVGFWC